MNKTPTFDYVFCSQQLERHILQAVRRPATVPCRTAVSGYEALVPAIAAALGGLCDDVIRHLLTYLNVCDVPHLAHAAGVGAASLHSIFGINRAAGTFGPLAPMRLAWRAHVDYPHHVPNLAEAVLKHHVAPYASLVALQDVAAAPMIINQPIGEDLNPLLLAGQLIAVASEASAAVWQKDINDAPLHAMHVDVRDGPVLLPDSEKRICANLPAVLEASMDAATRTRLPVGLGPTLLEGLDAPALGHILTDHDSPIHKAVKKWAGGMKVQDHTDMLVGPGSEEDLIGRMTLALIASQDGVGVAEWQESTKQAAHDRPGINAREIITTTLEAMLEQYASTWLSVCDAWGPADARLNPPSSNYAYSTAPVAAPEVHFNESVNVRGNARATIHNAGYYFVLQMLARVLTLTPHAELNPTWVFWAEQLLELPRRLYPSTAARQAQVPAFAIPGRASFDANMLVLDLQENLRGAIFATGSLLELDETTLSVRPTYRDTKARSFMEEFMCDLLAAMVSVGAGVAEPISAESMEWIAERLQTRLAQQQSALRPHHALYLDAEHHSLCGSDLAHTHQAGIWSYGTSPGKKRRGESTRLSGGLYHPRAVIPHAHQARLFSAQHVITFTLDDPSNPRLFRWRRFFGGVGEHGKRVWSIMRAGSGVTIPNHIAITALYPAQHDNPESAVYWVRLATVLGTALGLGAPHAVATEILLRHTHHDDLWHVQPLAFSMESATDQLRPFVGLASIEPLLKQLDQAIHTHFENDAAARERQAKVGNMAETANPTNMDRVLLERPWLVGSGSTVTASTLERHFKRAQRAVLFPSGKALLPDANEDARNAKRKREEDDELVARLMRGGDPEAQRPLKIHAL